MIKHLIITLGIILFAVECFGETTLKTEYGVKQVIIQEVEVEEEEDGQTTKITVTREYPPINMPVLSIGTLFSDDLSLVRAFADITTSQGSNNEYLFGFTSVRGVLRTGQLIFADIALEYLDFFICERDSEEECAELDGVLLTNFGLGMVIPLIADGWLLELGTSQSLYNNQGTGFQVQQHKLVLTFKH